jgi:hypothetical protein
MSSEKQLPTTTPQPVAFNFFDPVQFETMQRICKMFANSELVPDMYKVTDKNPIEKAMANCMIAVEMAQRISASPLMIMQNMVIIYGRPSWSSKFLVATVNTCGRFNPLQYRFTEKGMLGKVDYTEYEKVWIPGTNGGKGYYKNNAKTITFDGANVMDIECIAFTTARGSEKVLESSPVSIRLAIQEGWYTKAGSKWQTMTKQMLMYRAASFWTNAYAPELSMGMKTEDEVHDNIVDIEYEDVTDKVNEEIAHKANAGKTMSFDNGETADDDTPANVDKKTGEIKEPPATPTGSENQTPQTGPQTGNFRSRQTKMPGF